VFNQVRRQAVVALKRALKAIQLRIATQQFLDLPATELGVYSRCCTGLRAGVPQHKDAAIPKPVQEQCERERGNDDAYNHSKSQAR
jgi:hypothetical protein